MKRLLLLAFGLLLFSSMALAQSDVTPDVGWQKNPCAGLSDGDPIGTWVDSSAGGHDLTAAGGDRPTCKKSIINGKDVARFSGSNVLKSVSFSYHQPSTICFVGNKTGGTGSGGNGYFSDDRGGNERAVHSLDMISWTADAGVGLSQTVSDMSSYAIFCAVFNGTSSLVSYNGVVVTGDVGTRDGDGYILGDYGGGGYGVIGDNGEFRAYGSALSTGDRQIVEGRLACDYGLQSLLPGGHPYKTVCPGVSAKKKVIIISKRIPVHPELWVVN